MAEKHESYWEKRGWDPVANVKAATVIGTPSQEEEILAGSSYVVSGAAFDAGHHGGIKWNWKVQKKKGPFEIYARATTNSGVTQDETGIKIKPVDVLGYHTVDVEIVDA